MFEYYTLQTKNFAPVIEKLKIAYLGYLFDEEYRNSVKISESDIEILLQKVGSKMGRNARIVFEILLCELSFCGSNLSSSDFFRQRELGFYLRTLFGLKFCIPLSADFL